MASRDYVLTGERRAAWQRLLAATEDTPAHCDINTVTGMGWDDMTGPQQRRICRGCPVQQLCRAYAEIAPHLVSGTWGGEFYPKRVAAVREAARLEKQAQRAKEPKDENRRSYTQRREARRGGPEVGA